MHIDPKWFKRDFWTNEEAACLFAGANPDPDILNLILNPADDIYTSGKYNLIPRYNAVIEDVLELLEIFKRADWNPIVSSSSDQATHGYKAYFELAALKGIPTSTELENARQTFESEENHRSQALKEEIAKPSLKANQHQTISPEMFATLEPIINIIDEFKECPEHKNRGTNIQQQQITNWLDEKLSSEHEKRHTKELISKHYKIKTARK